MAEYFETSGGMPSNPEAYNGSFEHNTSKGSSSVKAIEQSSLSGRFRP